MRSADVEPVSQARPDEVGLVAVIFSSRRHSRPGDGYDEMADRMVELASQQPGFVDVESARGDDGFGITVSLWESDEAARAWKAVAEHLAAQRRGAREWYAEYTVRVARVERSYGAGPGTLTP